MSRTPGVVLSVLLLLWLSGASACRSSAVVCPDAAPPKAASDSASASPTTTQASTSAGEYDAALAARLGADDYGMRPYVIAFLRAGPSRVTDEAAAAELQRAHLDNIDRLAREGTLVLAGPFTGGGELRGIYVFAVSTVEEARALTATDPAIKAGHLVMELHPWYGSAAVVEIPAIHERVSAKKP